MIRSARHSAWILGVAAALICMTSGCRSKRDVCKENLSVIACAIESTVLEQSLYEGDPIPVDHIVLFMKGAKLPACPAGGKYVIPTVGGLPTCTVHGNLLAEVGWTWEKWPEGKARKRPPNQASHATSEPAPGAASSSHEG
jgi:hypothetical protein